MIIEWFFRKKRTIAFQEVLKKNFFKLFLVFIIWYFLYVFYSHPNQVDKTDLIQIREIPTIRLRTYVNEYTEVSRRCSSPQTSHNCIHIAMAATDLYLKPLLASINSILHHSFLETAGGASKKRDLYFHLLLAPGDANLLYDELFSYFREVPFELVEFNGDRVKPLIRVWHGMDRHSSNLNHARFFLPEIFPTLSEIIYLDPDTILNGDIGLMVEEFRSRSDRTKYFGAVISKKINLYSGTYDYLVNCHDPVIQQQVKDPNSKYFNAGVFITDLNYWRKEGVTSQLENWMRLNTQRKLWNWGSQAPLALVFYDKWHELNSDWNERRMQYYSWAEFTSSISPTVKLYHFSGEVKPWKSNGKSMWHLWCRYYPKKEDYWFCKDESWRNLSPSSMWSYEFLRGL